MSAKRDLYKSVNVEADLSNSKKNRRRTLAQGCLVTDPPGYDLRPKVEMAETSRNISSQSPSMMARMSLTKGLLDASKTHESFQNVSLQKSRTENFETLAEITEKAHSSTPRRGIPLSHYGSSPAALRPSVSLDLSDAESENLRTTRNKVVIIDSTKAAKDPDVSIGHSPVKVICHTQNFVNAQNLQSAESGEESLKVRSDPVASVAVAAADSADQSVARALFLDESSALSSTQNSIDDRLRVNESSSMAKSVDCLSEVKKKKKTARIIASRYMQGKPSVSSTKLQMSLSQSVSGQRQPMRATDRNILKRSVSSVKPRSTVLAPKRTWSSGSTRKLAPKITRGKSVTRTPEVVKKRGPKASTPEVEMASHLAVDLSAIDSHPDSLHKDHSHNSQQSATGLSLNLKSSRSKGTPSKRADDIPALSSQPEEFTQTHLDVLYARYLQQVYLEARAKHDFKLQEKHAMAQLHGLWQENGRLHKDASDLKLQLSKMKQVTRLDAALESQLNGLSPVIPQLGTVRQQYSTLAEALDTTRHQLATKDVYLPNDEPAFHENLQAALQESERLLGELSVMVRTKTPEISQFSQTLWSLTESITKQLSQMDVCSGLMSSAHALSTQESSLKIQDMQLKTVH